MLRLPEMYCYQGGYGYYVEPSILTFSNHGCNATFNTYEHKSFKLLLTGELTLLTEQNATSDDINNYGDFHYSPDELFDPFTDRHPSHADLSYMVATRDIKAGEELFSDYLWLDDLEEWYDAVLDLKKICSGEKVGSITEKERSSSKNIS